jgi:hypothetical protein
MEGEECSVEAHLELRVRPSVKAEPTAERKSSTARESSGECECTSKVGALCKLADTIYEMAKSSVSQSTVNPTTTVGEDPVLSESEEVRRLRAALAKSHEIIAVKVIYLSITNDEM